MQEPEERIHVRRRVVCWGKRRVLLSSRGGDENGDLAGNGGAVRSSGVRGVGAIEEVPSPMRIVTRRSSGRITVLRHALRCPVTELSIRFSAES